MPLPRLRLTIRWMMIAVAGVALFLFVGSKLIWQPLYVSSITRSQIGVTFLHSTHRRSAWGTTGSGEMPMERGSRLHYVFQADGRGGMEIVEYHEKTGRIQIGDRDYGAIRKGDVVDFGMGQVLVNGRPRSSVVVQPRAWLHRMLSTIPLAPAGFVPPQ